MGVVEFVLAGRSASLRDQPSELIELRKELDAMFWRIFRGPHRPATTRRSLLPVSTCYLPVGPGIMQWEMPRSLSLRSPNLKVVGEARMSRLCTASAGCAVLRADDRQRNTCGCDRTNIRQMTRYGRMMRDKSCRCSVLIHGMCARWDSGCECS